MTGSAQELCSANTADNTDNDSRLIGTRYEAGIGIRRNASWAESWSMGATGLGFSSLHRRIVSVLSVKFLFLPDLRFYSWKRYILFFVILSTLIKHLLFSCYSHVRAEWLLVLPLIFPHSILTIIFYVYYGLIFIFCLCSFPPEEMPHLGEDQ